MLLFWLKEVNISLQKIVMSHINAAWEGSNLLILSILTLRGHKIDRVGVGGGHGFHRGNKNTESAHETSHTNQSSFPSIQNHWAWNRFTAAMNALMNITLWGLLGVFGESCSVQAYETWKLYPNDGFSVHWWFPVRLLTYDHSNQSVECQPSNGSRGKSNHKHFWNQLKLGTEERMNGNCYFDQK